MFAPVQSDFGRRLGLGNIFLSQSSLFKKWKTSFCIFWNSTILLYHPSASEMEKRFSSFYVYLLVLQKQIFGNQTENWGLDILRPAEKVKYLYIVLDWANKRDVKIKDVSVKNMRHKFHFDCPNQKYFFHSFWRLYKTI